MTRIPTKPVATFKLGAIALVFLIIGFQIALFINRAAALRLVANRDHPDTVYVYEPLQEAAASANASTSASACRTELHPSAHSPQARMAYDKFATRRCESFDFDPNTVSVPDLQRLGFSERQAQSIDNYRASGGRFHRKEDFARSFVVADSVYNRLEKYICIPELDINRADSAAFDGLPGIGPYYAAQMVSYRTRLGGYSYPEQLMDLYRFTLEKFDAIADLISCDPGLARPFDLWNLPADSLRRHPYIGNWETAKAIVLYRENTPAGERSVESLAREGILPDSLAQKLSRCVLAYP